MPQAQNDTIPDPAPARIGDGALAGSAPCAAGVGSAVVRTPEPYRFAYRGHTYIFVGPTGTFDIDDESRADAWCKSLNAAYAAGRASAAADLERAVGVIRQIAAVKLCDDPGETCDVHSGPHCESHDTNHIECVLAARALANGGGA